jgi:hypothetical protein
VPGIGGAAVFGIGALLSPLDAFAAATSGQKGPYSTAGARSIRRSRTPTANDVKIGNHALTLKYLEAAFYVAAAQANDPDADIAAAAKTLAAHEAAHVAALKKVLGSAAVKAPHRPVRGPDPQCVQPGVLVQQDRADGHRAEHRHRAAAAVAPCGCREPRVRLAAPGAAASPAGPAASPRRRPSPCRSPRG